MNGGASRRALSTSTRQPSNEVNRGDTWFVSRRERDIIPGTGVGWPEDEGLVDAHYGRLRRLCELLLGSNEGQAEGPQVSDAAASCSRQPTLAAAQGRRRPHRAERGRAGRRLPRRARNLELVERPARAPPRARRDPQSKPRPRAE